MGIMPASKSVKTKRKFTVDEIFEVLKNEGDLPAAPFITGSGITRALYVPGIGQYDVSVFTMGKKITCAEVPTTQDVGKHAALDLVTDGWYSMIGRQNGIKEVVMKVADEVERLFKDRE